MMAGRWVLDSVFNKETIMVYLFVFLMASEGVPIEVKIGFKDRAECEAMQPTVMSRTKVAAWASGAKVLRSECKE